MKHARLRERFARIRDARAQARHNPVVEADTPAERDRIIAEGIASREIASDGALLIVPKTCDDFSEWERRCREGYYRVQNDDTD